MHKNIKNSMKDYDRSFWIYIAVILGLIAIIMIFNNYSSASGNNLVKEAIQRTEEIEVFLNEVTEQFEQYRHIIERLGENDLRTLEDEITVIKQQFLYQNQEVSGTFFKLFKEDGTILSEGYLGITDAIILTNNLYGAVKDKGAGYWESVSGIESSERAYIYFSPIMFNNAYAGYMGMIIPSESLEQYINKETDFLKYNIFSVNDELNDGIMEGDIISSILESNNDNGHIARTGVNGKQIYVYRKISDLIYIETYGRVKSVRHSNGMILMIGFFAVIAMWMMQEKKSTGKSIFTLMSDFVVKDYVNNINSIMRQGNLGTIALNIGMAAAVSADVFYSIALGRNLETILEYLIFMFMAIGIIFFYKYSKNGITEKIAVISIAAGMLGPFSEHISAGGFFSGRVGESHLWFVICLYIGLFILGAKKAVSVFNAFVVLMFTSAVFEVVIFWQSNYEEIYLFAISFILLGFVLFASMEVYVSEAAGHYHRTEDLIKRLNEDQRLLLQKEKLSALGRLISGVAHEINTPIGAIKASAETMSSLFSTIIKEVFEAASQFTEDEYECFINMVELTFESMSKMQSTLEVRTARKIVKKYFNEIDLDNADEILSYLGQLEIVDLEVIKENIQLFQMKNICAILNKTTKLTSFTTGIPTTIYAADRVTQIILALKSYVHTSALGEMIEFDIIKSIENVLILYRNQLKSNIKIIREYEKEECLIIGNPDELAQVWTNLIQNAVQAMKDGGELTIRVKEHNFDMIEITIGDTGMGISSQWMDKIFEPFFTTKKRGEGSGLGLNVSKKVIENHKGELKAESHTGEGTKFYIYLRKDGGIEE